MAEEPESDVRFRQGNDCQENRVLFVSTPATIMELYLIFKENAVLMLQRWER